jgi:hypothetical protein
MDRLEALTSAAKAMVDQTDFRSMIPPKWRPVETALRTFARLDLPTELQRLMSSQLASIPERARADPARAERVARFGVLVAAWLTDQVELSLDELSAQLERTFSPAPASPSSAPPAPVSQPSSDT